MRIMNCTVSKAGILPSVKYIEVILSEQEYHQYVDAHMKLLYHVGKEQSLIPPLTTMEAFLKLPFQRKYRCREELYSHIFLLDGYLDQNTEHLHTDEIQVLKGFKKHIRSDFIILKCLTRHAVFIDSKTNLIYAVKALSDRFDVFFKRFPVYCSTTILPFNGKIIYDGFINAPGNITLGPGITASLNENYLRARASRSVILTLE